MIKKLAPHKALLVFALSAGIGLVACAPKKDSKSPLQALGPSVQVQGGSEGVGGGDPFVSEFRLQGGRALKALKSTTLSNAHVVAQNLQLVLDQATVESVETNLSVEGIEKCARFNRKENRIQFRQSCWQSASLRGRTRLVLHELLGLQGVLDDSRYQVSTHWLALIEIQMPEISRTNSTVKALSRALVEASDRGELEAVRDLIDLGADPDFKNGLPFIAAVSSGQVEVVESLSAAGAKQLVFAVKELIRSNRIILDEDRLAISQKLHELGADLSIRLDEAYCKARLLEEDSNRRGSELYQVCLTRIGANALKAAEIVGHPKSVEFLRSLEK